MSVSRSATLVADNRTAFPSPSAVDVLHVVQGANLTIFEVATVGWVSGTGYLTYKLSRPTNDGGRCPVEPDLLTASISTGRQVQG